jgi:hypothetical protein
MIIAAAHESDRGPSRPCLKSSCPQCKIGQERTWVGAARHIFGA